MIQRWRDYVSFSSEMVNMCSVVRNMIFCPYLDVKRLQVEYQVDKGKTVNKC